MRIFRKAMNEVRWAFNIASWKPTSKDLLFVPSAPKNQTCVFGDNYHDNEGLEDFISEWINAASYLSQEEKKRVHQFVFKSDAMLAMTGRLLIRCCVNCLLGIPWNEIQLERTEKGKPFLVGHEHAISFNVSHQGNYSILAASTINEVGVDIMKIDRPVNTTIPDFFKTMRRQFTPEEWEIIRSRSTDREQMASFYRYWCLKESYVKAVGTGLGTSTAAYMRFELNSDSLSKEEIATDSVLYIDGKKVDWIFHESLLDDEHIATVAIKAKDCDEENINAVPFKCLSFDELTGSATAVCNEDETDWLNFSIKKEKVLRVFSDVK